jgi:hypothetical protein
LVSIAYLDIDCPVVFRTYRGCAQAAKKASVDWSVNNTRPRIA